VWTDICNFTRHPIYCRVTTVQLYHLDSTLSTVGELVVTPILLRLDVLGKPYYVTPADGARWVKCVQYECIRVFTHLCFQRCDPPIRSWVSWLSPDTFSEYIHGPRWDNVRNTRKDDVPSRPLRTPFSSLALGFTSAHSETCLAVLALIPRF